VAKGKKAVFLLSGVFSSPHPASGGELPTEAVAALGGLRASYDLFLAAAGGDGPDGGVGGPLAAGGDVFSGLCPLPAGAAGDLSRRLGEAIRSLGVRTEGSFFVADDPRLVEAAEGAGLCGLYILTPRGFRLLGDLAPDVFVFHDLPDAVRWILDHPEGPRSVSAVVRRGAAAIRRGGLVAFPTETVYGLGADALNPTAVARIFEVKRRPLHDPLIVHVADPAEVAALVTEIPPAARRLMDRFWPGPLTLVLPKRETVPDIVTAGHGTVAVRMPANRWARELIALAETPVAAPSANAFGRTSPTTARHVDEQLHGLYDEIIDGGACRVGIESTVLALAGGRTVVLRPGGLAPEEIREVTGEVELPVPRGAGGASPGMLASHYAPRTPLFLVDDARPYGDRPDVGLLLFRDPPGPVRGQVAVLSPKGDLREAAANLYQALRRLDRLGLRLIVAERVPPHGLGVAINDRLSRAKSGDTILNS